MPVKLAMPRFAASIISFLTSSNLQRGVANKLPNSAQDCLLLWWIAQQMFVQSLCLMFTMLQFRLFHGAAPEKQEESAQLVVRGDGVMQKCVPLLILVSFPLSMPTCSSAAFILTWLALFCILLGLLWHEFWGNSDWNFDCSGQETATVKPEEAALASASGPDSANLGQSTRFTPEEPKQGEAGQPCAAPDLEVEDVAGEFDDNYH